MSVCTFIATCTHTVSRVSLSLSLSLSLSVCVCVCGGSDEWQELMMYLGRPQFRARQR